MRKISFLSAILMVATLFSCNSAKKTTSNYVLTDTLIYKVQIYDPESNNNWDGFTNRNIETSKRKAFLEPLLEAINAGKIDVYDYETWAPIAKNKVALVGSVTETISVPSMLDPAVDSNVVATTKVRAQDINSIIFKEVWKFDTVTKKLEKEVLAFCPLVDKYIYNEQTKENEFKGSLPLYWIKTKAKEGKKELPVITDEISTGTSGTLNDGYLIRGDTLFLNQISSILTKNAQIDTSNVFYDSKCTEKKSKAEIKNTFAPDTVLITVPSLLDPSVDSTIVYLEFLNFKDLKGIRFTEKWCFDLNTQCFEKKIFSLGTLIACYTVNSETGKRELKGYRELFVRKN